MSCLYQLCGKTEYDESSGDEATDADAIGLSHVGQAAYDCLRRKHNHHHHSMWNVTSGKVIGEVHQTPLKGFPNKGTLPENHDDWFPEKMGEIVSRTKVWADVMSLGPPDGLFMDAMNKAIKTIAERKPEKPVIIRMMFGNIIGMPVNCTAVIKGLTEGVPGGSNVHVWVGAWRKAISWNHAKIVAIDGVYLHTGGHNMWDPHYLKNEYVSWFCRQSIVVIRVVWFLIFLCLFFNVTTRSPVHDLSFELEGRVATDGHIFANEQWLYVERSQETCIGGCVNKMPDWMFMPFPSRVTVSEYPEGTAGVYPPQFKKSVLPVSIKREDDHVPLITMGRPGAMYYKDRPSDDAIWAMIGSAKTIVRLALQDLGPVCVPGTKFPLPGLDWPEKTIGVLASIIWERGVDVEIVLSNPGSIPGDLPMTEACYGNGWSCVDVGAEIIKTIREKYPEATDAELRKKVQENLRISFIRQARGNDYGNGKTIGMHAKHFIVDDVCTYIGSQNLYICDLAEWGVVVDDEASTKKIMEEYWKPMWKVSYKEEDCDVDQVMDSLDIDRHTPGEAPAGVGAAAGAGVTPAGAKDYYGEEEEKKQ
jgi:hypothetical protein